MDSDNDDDVYAETETEGDTDGDDVKNNVDGEAEKKRNKLADDAARSGKDAYGE